MTQGKILFKIGDGENDYTDYVSPSNKFQLQQWLDLFFGLKVPSTSVCPGHSAPLDAAWASYSASSPVVVWKASRGLGGKTTLLGTLALLELLDGANVNVLGGSAKQSQRVHEIERRSWNRNIYRDGKVFSSPLKSFLSGEPTSYITRTKFGNELTSLTASPNSVRGPHPQRLRMDEVDEMRIDIFDAAMGQAMSEESHHGIIIKAQTTLSSTHQHPDGVMTEVLKRAKDRDWPVFEWCLSGGTRIYTPEGYKFLVDVQIGDEVLTYKDGGITVGEVTDVWSSGYQETCILKTTQGEVRCTPEHRFLLASGEWRRASLIGKGDVLKYVSPKGKLLTVTVLSVEPGLIIEVFDLTVNGTQNFIAEGLVAHNCYRETHVDNDGWLTEDEKEDKRNTVNEVMWSTEYELQEPSTEGRALSSNALLFTFKESIGELKDRLGAYYEFEPPSDTGAYSTGVDWARDKDFTVIITVRFDVSPKRIVAYERAQHEPYPSLISRAQRQRDRYGSQYSAHDATGIGAVITDYLEGEWIDFKVHSRAQVFGDFLIALEEEQLESPKIDSVYDDFKYCRLTDLYGTGHPPDSMFAAALAWTGVTGRIIGKKVPKKPGRVRAARLF